MRISCSHSRHIAVFPIEPRLTSIWLPQLGHGKTWNFACAGPGAACEVAAAAATVTWELHFRQATTFSAECDLTFSLQPQFPHWPVRFRDSPITNSSACVA